VVTPSLSVSIHGGRALCMFGIAITLDAIGWSPECGDYWSVPM
jgi:hypothetical protein